MHDGPPYSHTRSSIRNEELHAQPAPAQAPPSNNTKRRDRGAARDGEDAGAKMTETENANKDLWAQILKRGEEIYRQASDAQRRDFSLDEIKHVEFLASSILTEVRGMIASDPKTLSSPSLSPSSVDISQTSELEDGPLKKRRGRPPIKKPMCCQQCGTTETPEWRRGESGPNTLCNGCGLRYAKRVKMQEEALNNKGKQKTRSSSNNHNSTNNNSNGNNHSTHSATNQNTNNKGSNGTPKGGKNKPKPKLAAQANPPPLDPQSPEPSPMLRPKIEQEEQQLTNSYLYHYPPPYPPDGVPHTSSHPSRPPVEADPLSIVSESHAPPAWESSLGLSPTHSNSHPTSPLPTPPPTPHSPCSPAQPSEHHSSPESHPPHMSPYPMQIHSASMQGIAHAKGMPISHHMQVPMHVALPNSLQPSLSPSDSSFSHPKSPYTPRISPYQQYSPYQSPHHFSMTAANLQQISSGMHANLQHSSSLPQNVMSNVHAMHILQSPSQEQPAYPEVSAAVRQMHLQKIHQQHLQETLQYQSQQHAQAQQHEQTQQQAQQHAKQYTQTHHLHPAQTQQHMQTQQPASPQQLMQHQLRQELHQKQQQQLHLQQQQQQQQQIHPSMQQMMQTQLYRQIHQYDLPPELQQQQQMLQQETLTSPLHNLTPEQFHTLQSLHPSIPVSGYLQELYLQQQQQQHLYHLQLQQHQQQQQIQIQEQREREHNGEQHNHQHS